MTQILIALVLQAFISAALSAYVASEKGRVGGTWFILGLLFGILGLIAIAGLPVVKGATCQLCREQVYPEATICPHCQGQIQPQHDVELSIGEGIPNRVDREDAPRNSVKEFRQQLMLATVVVGIVTVIVLAVILASR